MVNRRRFIAAAAALPLSACKIRTINYFPTTPASVRYVNLLPDGGPLDIYNGATNVWSAVAVEASVPYEQFEPVQTNFGVNQTGSATQLTNTSTALSGKQPYTLLTYGSLANPSALLIGDTTLSVPSGTSQYRLFHGALGISAADFYVTAPEVDYLKADATFFNIGYSNGTVFVQVAAGNYVVRMCAVNTKIVLYESATLNFPSGIATDLFIYSRSSALLANLYAMQVNGEQAVAIFDSRQSRLKVVNAASQTGDVNFLIDGAATVTGLHFGEASAYQIPVPGSHALSFEATAVPGATIASTTRTLAAATDSTVFVAGFAGATVAIVLNDNNLIPPNGNGRFRFVNASPDAPPVDVFVNDVKAASGIAYTKASGYYEIAPNTCNIRFVDPISTAVLLSLTGVALQSSYIISVYMLGAAAAATGLVTTDNLVSLNS